ncbi:hypothetical protein ACTHQY_15015 [Rhodococcoides corynebacterioides]|uniref:hypothetical protein n=1 Tax=Rhodococcoides corynebacterioides TaxID=53972 RepID=UPI003F7E61A4
MGTAPVWSIEYLGRVDWSSAGRPSRQWGFQKHRLGFYVKIGDRGLSVRNPWVKR